MSTPRVPTNPRRRRNLKPFAVLGLLLGLTFGVVYFFLLPRSPGDSTAKAASLVVYCAHDSIYAEPILRAFEKKSGIAVQIRFDSEATKSLGLEEMLLREKDAPRCDVFWNNGPLGTMNLAEHGVLRAYKGPGWKRIPDAFKDADGKWAGFAAQLRVYIVNTERDKLAVNKARSTISILDPVQSELFPIADLTRVAIAKPLYGTTLTHYSVLWKLGDDDGLLVKHWHADWKKRGAVETTGNAQVANLVATGVCDIGLTDSDDYFVVKDEGKPVLMLPFEVSMPARPAFEGLASYVVERNTICIPNTAAIISGSSHVEQAEKLVDYLLSEECELALAASKSRQVPLGPVDETKLSPEVKELKEWASHGYPLQGLEQSRAACLAWLKKEYLGE